MKRILLVALACVSTLCSAQTFKIQNLDVLGTSTLTGLASFTVRPQFNGATPWDSANLPLPVSIANGGTGLSGLGSGVQTGLGAAVNTGNGFVTYAQNALSGAGITPYAYGAVGNGSADDTTAIQNWANAIASTGEQGFCSPGIYKISKTINLTGVAAKITGPGGTQCAITPAFGSAPTISGTAAGASYGGGATSIRLTIPGGTANIGAAVEITGVVGTTEANGGWPDVVIDSTHIDIVGPTYANAYVSGGSVIFPAFAVVPPSAGSASQPTLDLSGVYMAPPSANASATDFMVVTGGAFNSSGSNVNLHDFIENGYRTGVIFWQSFAPILRNIYFYNNQSAAIVANQDISFSNSLVDHVEFFSNGNTFNNAAMVIGGAFWVEAPNIVHSQFSGNYAGLNFAGNVNGANVQGNYLEQNTSYNFNCTGAASNGAHIVGNWFSQNAGTITTALTNCTGAFFASNWLNNQVFSLGTGSVSLPSTNTLTGTGKVSIALYTVAGLPTCNVNYQGVTVGVTDATAPSYNGTLTGGGLTTTLAYCNGATWTAH